MYQKSICEKKNQDIRKYQMSSESSGSSYWVWGERGQQAFTVSPSTQSAVTWSLQEKTLITNFVSFFNHVCNFFNKERETLAENLDQRAFIVISKQGVFRKIHPSFVIFLSCKRTRYTKQQKYLSMENGNDKKLQICSQISPKKSL